MEQQRRADPQVLGDGVGVAVYGLDCAEAASAFALLRDLLEGRVAPGAARQARMTRRMEMLRAAFTAAAQQQQADKHRRLAAMVARPQPAAPVPLVAPAQSGGSSQPATITVRQAADVLHVSPQRVRVLCGDGRLAARRTDRAVWLVDRDSVATYRDRRERRRANDGGSRAEGGTAGRP